MGSDMMIEDKSPKKQDGYYVTKKKLIIAIVIVVVAIVAVGVTSAMIARGGHQAGQVGGTNPTSKEPTQPQATTTRRPKPTSPKVKPTSKYMTPTTMIKATDIPEPKPTPFTGTKAVLNSLTLPKNVKPIHYRFSLDIDVMGRKFSGSNVAEFDITSSTDIVVIHKKMMKLLKKPELSTDMQFPSDKLISLKDVGYYERNEYLFMITDQPLQPGKYYARFEFEANLTNNLFGLYMSNYRRDSTGEIVWIVGSQCAPAEARRIMPLFDEPALKAKFSATITVASNYTPLWNMPSTGKKDNGNGKVTYDYETSVQMSTYLLAFMISDFISIEAKTNRGTMIRVWAPKDVVQHGQYALTGGVKMTEYFEELLNQTYVLPKQDMVAIQNFHFSAMENWGLIFYVQRALLFDESDDGDYIKERIARIVCHELAHQWFGNLLTLHWWSNIWLNEGFATLYEYVVSSKFEPTWDLMNLFVDHELHTGLAADASQFSHPMEVHYFPHNSMIINYFTRIEYNKAGSVLRMLRTMTGEKSWDTSIRSYIQEHKWKEVYPSDLWRALQKNVGNRFNVTEVANTWVQQMGHPIVTVENDRYDAGRGIFTQQRFLTDNTLDPNSEDPASPHKSPFGYKWNIPIAYQFENNMTRHHTLMKMDQGKVLFDWPKDKWIKVNTHQFGYYRVNYPQDNWNRLASALKKDPETLDERDVSNLLDDAFTFANAKKLKYGTAMNLTKFLYNETRYLPWTTAMIKLMPILDRLDTRATFGYFGMYYKHLIMPMMDSLQFEDEGDHLERLLRIHIMATACRLGNHACIKHASTKFMHWMMNESSVVISPNLREIIYSAGVAVGGAPSFNFLWHKLNTTYKVINRGEILRALSRTMDPWLLNKYMTMAIHSPMLKSSERIAIFDYVASTPTGRYMAWEFLKRNMEKIYDYFADQGEKYMLQPMIYNSVKRFNDMSKYKEVKMVAEYYADQAGETEMEFDWEPVNEMLDRIHENIEWLDEHEEDIIEWCKALRQKKMPM